MPNATPGRSLKWEVLLAGMLVWEGCGLFQKMQVDEPQVGAVEAVVVDHTGPYHQIADKIQNVRAYLEKRGETPGEGIGIYYDAPDDVRSEQLRSQGGCLVTTAVSVEAPYMRVTLPARPVVHTRFRGHPALGALKAYRALHRWMKAHGEHPAGPAWEIYCMEGKTMRTDYYLPVEAAPR